MHVFFTIIIFTNLGGRERGEGEWKGGWENEKERVWLVWQEGGKGEG